MLRLHLPKPLQTVVYDANMLFVHSIGYLLYSLNKCDHFDYCVSPEL